MSRDPGPGGEDQRRPTAVDDVMWRLAERRARDLGLDWKSLVKDLSSRSTAWRSDTKGASPQLLRKVEAALTEHEETRGNDSKGAMLRAWNELGAELLMLDDEGATFRRAQQGVHDILALAKKLQSAISAFQQPTPDDHE